MPNMASVEKNKVNTITRNNSERLQKDSAALIRVPCNRSVSARRPGACCPGDGPAVTRCRPCNPRLGR